MTATKGDAFLKWESCGKCNDRWRCFKHGKDCDRAVAKRSAAPDVMEVARNMVQSPDNWPPMRVKQVAEALLAACSEHQSTHVNITSAGTAIGKAKEILADYDAGRPLQVEGDGWLVRFAAYIVHRSEHQSDSAGAEIDQIKRAIKEAKDVGVAGISGRSWLLLVMAAEGYTVLASERVALREDLENARREAIEEAAKVAEAARKNYEPNGWASAACESIAFRIRSLATGARGDG